jgi:hypothetical protein
VPLASSEIRVGVNGAIYAAPGGTVGPVDINAAWPAAFIHLGYATTDGVTLQRTLETEQVNSWQAVSPQRYLITGVGLTAGFSLQQFNKTTLPLYLGGGSWVAQGGGSYKYSILNAPSIDERVLGVEWTDGATIKYRAIIVRGMVSETGELTIGRESEINLPITFSAMSADPDLGYLLTNDPAMA